MAEEKVKKTATKKTAVKKAPAEKAKVVKTTSEAGISIAVFDLLGKEAGKVTLPREVFGEKENPTLIAQAVRVYLANQRVGHASTKTRGEVAGTTKKIYRQKGTGRARHGAAKAPIFVGGGITFGPKPRDFSLDMPKKMKRKALFSALSGKLAEKKITVVDWTGASGKTKEISGALKSLSFADKKGNVKRLTLVVDKGIEAVKKASRNIEGVSVKNVTNLSAYDVVQSNNLLFAKSSIDVLKETFLKGGSK